MPRDPSYPRPQLRREAWELLDGPWDFAADADATWTHPRQVVFEQTISVPFAPETKASGVATTELLRRCWYRRELTVTPPPDGGRLLLHFGAVDRIATIWVDGRPAGSHVGGHTPFTIDLTDHLPAMAMLVADEAPVQELASAAVAGAPPGAPADAGAPDASASPEEQAAAAVAEAAAAIVDESSGWDPDGNELMDRYPDDAAIAVAEAVVAAAAASEPPVPVTIEVVVQADDQPRTMTIPRGKQDWWPEPHMIWYPRTTGIWQSVWLEEVPATRITELRWQGDAMAMAVTAEVVVTGTPASGDRVRVQLRSAERTLVDDVMTITDVVDGRAALRRTFPIGSAGVDDPFSLIWRPGHPALLDATIELHRAAGDVADRVESYTALRTIEVVDGQVALNGRPVKLRLALDQGYWPETGMTAPSVDALHRDVQLIRDLGLHGVRKHQKIEDPRWLALCDELGVVVWEELPSAYAFDVNTVHDLTQEWMAVVERDRNHPCIIAWVPVNESWGAPLAATDPQQRALIRSLTELTRALDPTRLVSANDGWETLGGDIVGIHDYEQDPAIVAARYADADALARVLTGFGPGGRRVTIDDAGPAGRAVMLTELGGTTLAPDAGGLFGYGNLTDADAFVDRYRALCAAVLASDVLSGFCWTQLTDTFQEANGLLTMAREPKAPIEVLRAATRGR